MNVFGRVLETIEDTLHIGGCLSLVLVAVLINADIILRIVLQVPVQFQFEVTELYLMPALATLSLSRVFRDGGHLALDFVKDDLPGPLGLVITKLRLLIPAAFFATVTFMSGKFALNAFANGAVEYGVIDWPLGWAYVVVPLGTGVLVLRLINDAFLKKQTNAEPLSNH